MTWMQFGGLKITNISKLTVLDTGQVQVYTEINIANLYILALHCTVLHCTVLALFGF